MENSQSKSSQAKLCRTLSLLTVIAINFIACGNLEIDTNRFGFNNPTGNTAVISSANFGDPTGSLAIIDQQEPLDAQSNLALTHSDTVLRVFNNKIYAINRLGADNIQIVNASTLDTELQFSTGNGTNPYDLVVPANDERLFIALYQPEDNASEDLDVDDIIVMDPADGAIIDSIDLTPFTDNDEARTAGACKMLLVDSLVYVLLQDLNNFVAESFGKLVIFDPSTLEVTKSITLNCKNPQSMDHAQDSQRIYISCANDYSGNSAFGGIEVVDTTNQTTLGLQVTDSELGGTPGTIKVDQENVYTLVASGSKLVKLMQADLVNSIELVYQSSTTYSTGLAIDTDNLLWFADRDLENSGIIIIDPSNNEVVAGPINVGAAPGDIVFINK